MFLLGREFLLLTDYGAVANLLERDLPPTLRIERWILRLLEYTFSIQHQRGIDNVMADVFSRLPFARRSVVEADLTRGESSHDRTTRNIEGNGYTGCLSDVNRPGPSAFSCENSCLNFQSLSRPTLGDSVATSLIGSVSAGSGDSQSEMGDSSYRVGLPTCKLGFRRCAPEIRVRYM